VETPELDYLPTMPVFIRRLASAHPDADLIVTPEGRMTYGDAEAWSRRLAKDLLARGVGKGTRVAFMFGNGIEWVVTFIATARVGGLAMPFSTLYRPAELRTALRLGDVDTLIVPSDLMGKDHLAFMEETLPSLVSAAPPLRLPEAPFLRSVLVSGPTDRVWASPVPAGAPAPAAATTQAPADDISDAFLAAVEGEVHPADPMMVIFTSGVTAEPKGVIHTHGCWVRHTANVADATDTPFDQRLLCGLPFFWIGGVSTSLGVAMQRRSALLCTAKFDPEAAMALIAHEHPTGIMMLPGLLDRLRAHAAATGATLELPGAAPSPTTRRGAQLGMTETCAAYIVNGHLDQTIPPEHADAHGFRVPGMQYRIADLVTGETLADGEEGEICVRGYNVTGAMCKRERQDIFDDDGWYHTGDKGILRGPYITYRGRAKDLIKTLGANVAPREVEVRLDADPGVLMSVVMGLPDPQRDEIVAAVLVPASGADLDPVDVINRAARDLSAYKVPRRVLVLPEPEMPYLSTGKPDRKRLRELLVTDGTDLPAS
jgi:acyl-CoA synthetase (AMP-forming)/AMP-acid ligase II